MHTHSHTNTQTHTHTDIDIYMYIVMQLMLGKGQFSKALYFTGQSLGELNFSCRDNWHTALLTTNLGHIYFQPIQMHHLIFHVTNGRCLL